MYRERLFFPKYRTEEILNEISYCLEIGWTGMGYKTLDFEEAWKEYTGLPNAHFLNSATAGLHLAVKILKEDYGWKDGSEIITTPLTFVSTNHVIIQENLEPVFTDIDHYLCLDPIEVERNITSKTVAVMYVGMGGNTGQLKQIKEICYEHDLLLILDASHMSGTKWLDGTHVGKEADVSIFSFQAVKNLPTADSGMICFRSDYLDKEVRKWSWLGIDKDTYSRSQDNSYKWKYSVEHLGFKYHGNSIMAAMGLVGLRYLDKDNEYRRYLSELYDRRLEGNVELVEMHPDCIPSRHLYQVSIFPYDRLTRDDIVKKLGEKNIGVGVHYIDNKEYKMYIPKHFWCNKASYYSDHILTLPLHLFLDEDDIDYISDSLLTLVG